MSLRYSRKLMCLIVLSFGLSACQSMEALFGADSETSIDPHTLAALKPATLQPATMKANETVAEGVKLQSVIDSYRALLPLLAEPETHIQVLHRLADLKMAKGETLMAEQAVDELGLAVEAYNDLLTKYPGRSNNDQVYYQLAKSYDLQGKRAAHLAALNLLVANHPDSELMTEVQFRRGEILFSNGEYRDAQAAFESVISTGESVYLANAYYMKGWSLFKQGDYESALLSYTKVLDRVLPADQKVESVDQRNRTMVEDLLRVMGLSFSYLGGADSLEKLFARTGAKPYEILVYDRYSELLLNKEQYSDAISVYQRFIALHPMSLWSPRYQINIISTLRQAGFTKNILSEKERFVAVYRKGEAFWNSQNPDDLVFVKSQLEVLLPELANRRYVLARQGVDHLQKTNSKHDDLEQARNKNFDLAADYYASFIETFPAHSETPGLLFLLGECHVQRQRWAQAILAFERAGYEFDLYDKASEAAYASILAYNDYALTWKTQTPAQLEILRSQQQQSRLRFASRHAQDSRAIDVLFVATTNDFENKRYQDTVLHAQQVIDWLPAPKDSTLLEARLLKAHSYYALKSFADAEQAYKDALDSMSSKGTHKDKRYLSIVENLAASVFQQAEVQLAAGNKEMAINEFLRVGSVAPNSELRSSAEYDAANYLLELKQWSRVIDVLTAFRARYPKHALLATLPAKLALAYRETGQWELAANELNTLYENAHDPQEKQDTLYSVAELYDRAKNYPLAILRYRSYANTYPEPMDSYMEAANRLAELYQLTDKPLKRRFWLTKQMLTVDAAPDKADERMRYLAASASAVLANDAYLQYKGIKLTLPLDKAMIKKTKALEKAMKAYQKTASYGVSFFSTEAGFQMADLYARLSVDLMESERPPGLSELEMEQYEILLEEQVYPFEDSAIAIHAKNVSRSWVGIYDEWVKNSFESLKKLLPGRYAKEESAMEVFSELN